jgi:hypothetical protein
MRNVQPCFVTRVPTDARTFGTKFIRKPLKSDAPNGTKLLAENKSNKLNKLKNSFALLRTAILSSEQEQSLSLKNNRNRNLIG